MMYVRFNHAMSRSLRRRHTSPCFPCFPSDRRDHMQQLDNSDDDDEYPNENTRLHSAENGNSGYGPISRVRSTVAQRQPSQCQQSDPVGYKPIAHAPVQQYYPPTQTSTPLGLQSHQQQSNQRQNQHQHQQQQQQQHQHQHQQPLQEDVPALPPPPCNSEAVNLAFQRAQRAFGKQSAAFGSLQAQTRPSAPPQ